MGMDGIVIFMYRMVQWIYIKKKCDKVLLSNFNVQYFLNFGK